MKKTALALFVALVMGVTTFGVIETAYAQKQPAAGSGSGTTKTTAQKQPAAGSGSGTTETTAQKQPAAGSGSGTTKTTAQKQPAAGSGSGTTETTKNKRRRHHKKKAETHSGFVTANQF